MREIFTYGSVGGAPGNRCFYPEIGIHYSFVGEICNFAFEKTVKICNYPFIVETPSRIYTFFVLVPRK